VITLAAFVIGILAALLAGAASGVLVGKSALGAELSAYMGGLYGVIAGSAAVIVTKIILVLV